MTNKLLTKEQLLHENEELRINEEKLNLIINSSPIGICTADMLGNFVTTNPAYERMVGYSKEELVGLSFFDVTHPNDRPKNKKLFQDMFSLEKTGFSIEKRYIRKDGVEIKVSVHAIGISDAEGNIKFGTAFVEDITERKETEDKLQKSEYLYKQLFKELPYGCEILSVKGEIVDCNPSTSRMLGYEKADLIGRHITNFIDAKTKKIYRDNFPKTLKGEAISVEACLIHKNGSKINALRTATPIINTKGEVESVLGLSVDISKLKLVEEALKKNIASLQQAEFLAQLGYFERNWQTGEGYWSEGFFELLGIKEKTEVLSHRDFTKFIHPDDFECVSEHIQKTLIEHKPMDIEFRLVQANGSIIHIHGISENYYDKDDKPILTVGVMQDITDRKEAEIEIKEKIEELRRWNKAILGREKRILDLKCEVNELLVLEGKEPRYASTSSDELND